MNVEEEKAIARRNINCLQANMPNQLSAREDRLPDQIKQSKKNTAKKLESLYGFMNELYSFASKYAPCKKGCSDCCYYPVTISEVEIAYIERNTKIKRNKQFKQNDDYHGIPCPFLANGSCSIYESRPFVCRRHVALTKTNEWCHPTKCNEEKFTVLRFTGIDGAYDEIRRGSKSFDLHDIRQIFG